MTKLTQEQLNDILDRHELWINDSAKGERANLRDHDLARLDISNRNLTKANCRGANFTQASCQRTYFDRANCYGTDFSSADLNTFKASDANFNKAIFRYSNLRGADLLNTNLHELWVKDNTKGKQADLSDHDLARLDLSNRNLTKANFQGANCRGANFYGANCRFADFTQASCQRTYFDRANCYGTDFSSADLNTFKASDANFNKAIFRYSNLRGADLLNTNLHEADLQDANVSCIKGKVIAAIQGLQGECGRQITVLAEGEEKDWVIFCGCFIGIRDDLTKWLNTARREGHQLESTLLAVDYLFKACRAKHNND